MAFTKIANQFGARRCIAQQPRRIARMLCSSLPRASASPLEHNLSLPPSLQEALELLQLDEDSPLQQKADQTANQQRLFQPQLNYAQLRLHADKVAANNAVRGTTDLDFNRIVAMANLVIRAEHDAAELRRMRSQLSEKMKEVMGKTTSMQRKSPTNTLTLTESDASQLVEMKAILSQQSLEIKKHLQALDEQIAKLNRILYSEARHIPNDTHPQTPLGEESNAVVLDTFGAPRKADPSSGMDRLRTHLELAEMHNMLEIERAGKVSGSRFYYLKNAGTMLELALMRYATDVCLRHGFTPVATPDLVRHEVLEACGFSPRSQDPQTYYVSTSATRDGSDEIDPMSLCLAATAEFPLAGMYAGETLEDLPVRMVGLGHAFRAEGLSGATNRGLYRVHQFTKVEMFALTQPEDSMTTFHNFVTIQREIFEGLEICFRILNMPTLELGAPAYLKYDIEAWMPGRAEWGEISSTSNCTDYQARRLNIRMFNKSSGDAKQASINKQIKAKKTSSSNATTFVHTINGTACAIPRIIIALLETHQQADGSVRIPEKLRPYLFGRDVSILRPEMSLTATQSN